MWLNPSCCFLQLKARQINKVSEVTLVKVLLLIRYDGIKHAFWMSNMLTLWHSINKKDSYWSYCKQTLWFSLIDLKSSCVAAWDSWHFTIKCSIDLFHSRHFGMLQQKSTAVELVPDICYCECRVIVVCGRFVLIILSSSF